ncbi:D-glycerate dehydrogenase [Sphingosinicella sp. BN140058]|uniref:2-hydroxyacid dehydrogenase n=1 Tax=Sphingosinicella sp. BN140058 TaxID=1892855 RepID=UPI0010121DE5|nr:D-glycerate dehydrogenase [Sphingosinicella sp. BN140058]QAY75204.1 D-glycerate dehydrogenase [Sphingosinicella sp. BN140058]
MPTSRPRIIVTRRLPEPVEERLIAEFDAEVNHGPPFDRAQLADAVQRCDALACTVTDRLDAEMIGQAGADLKLLANFGVGVDHIDLAAAAARGILVSNTPDVLTDDTADVTLALILGTLRGLGEGERVVRAGQWAGWGPRRQMGRSLTGKHLAIVGMGRIGLAVAARARACGMRIHYHNRRRVEGDQAFGATYWPDLDSMIEQADVLSLSCPYTAETHHLIDGARLRRMPADAFLINAARGAIVDQEALIAALERGEIAGAGLDVYPNEPHVDPRLIALPNVMLLPHLGSATVETRIAMGEKVVANISAWAKGEEMPDRV